MNYTITQNQLNALTSKKAIIFYICFFILLLGLCCISSGINSLKSSGNVHAVSLSIIPADSPIQNEVSLYVVSPSNNTDSIKPYNNEWTIYNRYIKHIRIALKNKKTLDKIKKVVITIDNTPLTITRAQLRDEWQAITPEEKIPQRTLILESPTALSPGKTSHIPKLRTIINWKGDISLIVSSCIKSLFLILLIIFLGTLFFMHTAYYINRRPHEKTTASLYQKYYYPITYAYLIGTLFIILFLRSYNAVLYPTISVEDGATTFAHYYNHRNLSELFRYKAGYMPLLQNIIGYGAIFLPTRAIPYFLAWFPFILSIIAYSLFFLKTFRVIIENDLIRLLICIILALSPHAYHRLLTMTDYSTWNCLYILILLSMIKLPAKRKWLFFALYTILVWGHPLSIVVIPLLIYQCIKDTNKLNRILYITSIINTIIHHIITIESGALALSFPMLVKNMYYSLYFIITEVIFKTPFGDAVITYVLANHTYLIFIYVTLLTVFLIVFTRFKNKKLLIFSLYLIAALSYLNLTSRGIEFLAIKSKTDLAPVRYTYLQSIFFLFIIINQLFSIKKHPKLPPISSPIIHLTVLTYFFLLNLIPGNIAIYNTKKEEGVKIRTFIKALATKEKELGSRKGIYMKYPGRDEWPIIINTKQKEQ